MLLVADDRHERAAVEIGEFDPGAASAELFIVGNPLRRVEPENPHQRDVQALTVSLLESLANDAVVENMEFPQGGEIVQVVHHPGPLEDSSEPDFDFFCGFRGEGGPFGQVRFGELLVEPCRKQEKIAVLEREPAGSFGDAALAQEDALPPVPQSITNNRPFLECNTHVTNSCLPAGIRQREMMPAMLHRFDLHVHSFFSKDAAGSPESLIDAALARGLSGIAITDHDTCEAHEYLKDKPLPPGFLVVPGVEVSTAEGHLLCLGLTLPFLKRAPVKEVFEAVKAGGGIAIPAHPFDQWRAGIRPAVLDTLDLEAIEVFNAAVTSKGYNEKALAYARSRGLSMTAGSDAHHSSAVGVSATAFEMEELTIPALLDALRKGGTPDGHYLSFREGVKKHLANWFRKANPKPPR